jgi:glycerophosphoryl diester phosphodiesterase
VNRPLVIGHRGACGYRPEHTRASFEMALEMGADALETDLVPTRDGVLICRHDAELSLTTDVPSRLQFAERRTTKVVDGAAFDGWFVEDFTWEEIQTLRCRERLSFRDHRFDDQLPIMSLYELLQLAAEARAQSRPDLLLVLELKHPTYFAAAGLDVDQLLMHTLESTGAVTDQSPMIVESFDVSILRRMRERSSVRLIQLLDRADWRPFDFQASDDPRTYVDLMTPNGLQEIASYADAIGAWKRLIVPARTESTAADVRLDAPTSLIDDAHAAGLDVHAWTFRSEPQFLAADYNGDAAAEYEQFRGLGLDGFITDSPDDAHAALG